MRSLDYIVKKYNLDCSGKRTVEIPGAIRSDLGDIFRELMFSSGAEVGVESGIFSEVLLKKNPGLKLFCIDSWKFYEGYNNWSDERFEKDYKKAINRLKPYNAVLIKKFSMDAVKDFDDNSLDFVYIDGNHSFQHVVNDICEWTKKVKKGGIVGGHDYIKIRHRKGKDGKREPMNFNVVEAVTRYIISNNIRPLFLLGEKIDKNRERFRSWFFVKE